MISVSIITICFNNLDELKATCASVDMQHSKPYEHIIIDGSTKPDIKNFLENNPQPAYRKWICERDKGISDAFNKGILKATGEITNLLNSGDTLYDETVLQRVADLFKKKPEIQWCHGKLNTLRGGLWVHIGKPFERDKLYRGMRGMMHPTMYVRREMYDKHGLFDVNLKLSMDYDFLCRVADEPNAFIDYPLATFDPAGVSSSNYIKAMKESYGQYRKYFGPSIKQTVWEWRLTFLHHLLGSKLGKFLYRLKVKAGKENA
jgi:glycosyltransferase involved in cell wall biosynthesis